MALRRSVQWLYFSRNLGLICILVQASLGSLNNTVGGKPDGFAFVFHLLMGSMSWLFVVSYGFSEPKLGKKLIPDKTLVLALPLIFCAFNYLIALLLFMRLGYVSVWAGFPRYDMIMLNGLFLLKVFVASVFFNLLWLKGYCNKMRSQFPAS